MGIDIIGGHYEGKGKPTLVEVRHNIVDRKPEAIREHMDRLVSEAEGKRICYIYVGVRPPEEVFCRKPGEKPIGIGDMFPPKESEPEKEEEEPA